MRGFLVYFPELRCERHLKPSPIPSTIKAILATTSGHVLGVVTASTPAATNATTADTKKRTGQV
jgi:hypothetical protein